jgi:CRISPR system Cascade subunit CasD
MRDHLILDLDAPLQAWGGEAFDSRRATRLFPGRSALAGLLANAMGWSYADDERTTGLQTHLRHAVVEIRRPEVVRDYATASVSPPADPIDSPIARYGQGGRAAGWTTHGQLVRRGGAKSTLEGRHLMDKLYLAGGRLLVAVTLTEGAPCTVAELAPALKTPARPLYLGRRSCPPAARILLGTVAADSPAAALRQAVSTWLPEHGQTALRAWADTDHDLTGQDFTIYDMRLYGSGRFLGGRGMVEGLLQPTPG